MSAILKAQCSMPSSLRAFPARTTACKPVLPRASTIRVRAQQPEGSSQPSKQGGTVFFGGVSYTEEQWKDAVARNEFAQAPANTQPVNGSYAAPSVMEVMGFSGSPEIINGRLAMLGIVAALGAELNSGDSIVRQIGSEPTLISLTFVLFAAASLVPAFAQRKPDIIGPFTPEAEMTNGRAAMIGFASMLVIEGVRGIALF